MAVFLQAFCRIVGAVIPVIMETWCSVGKAAAAWPSLGSTVEHSVLLAGFQATLTELSPRAGEHGPEDLYLVLMDLAM